jgi:hypothetical protein
MTASSEDDTKRKRPPRLSKEVILQIATRAGFPDPRVATAIALAESGGNPAARLNTTREDSVGLWQINTRKHPYTPEEMVDPIKNAAAAFQISNKGTNWRPWSTYKTGSYRKFLTGVLA